MDKLSKRITKMQTDNQMRFSDLENNPENIVSDKKISKKEKLPGTDLPGNLGRISDDDLKYKLKFKKHNRLVCWTSRDRKSFSS